MTKVRIRQVRSSIDRSQRQKRTLQALGLRKINGTVEHELNDTIRGMIFRVSHLVEVEEIDGAEAAMASTATKTANAATARAGTVSAILEEE